MATQVNTGITTRATTLIASDASGLDAHAQTLTGIGALVQKGNLMLENVESQMKAAGMGEKVTTELAVLRDQGTAYITQAIKARAVLEQVNRAVQEAYDASGGQAADKGYQMNGR